MVCGIVAASYGVKICGIGVLFDALPGVGRRSWVASRATQDLTRRAYQAQRARNRRTAQDSQFRLAINAGLGKNALELISARFLGDPVFGCDGFKSDTGRDLGREPRFCGRQSECCL